MVRQILSSLADSARALNTTLWGGVEGAEKVGKIVKSGLSGADVIIGTSHTLEDASCGDFVCATLDAVGSVSSAVGMILGNIPATKQSTIVTGSVTLCCRTVRWLAVDYSKMRFHTYRRLSIFK